MTLPLWSVILLTFLATLGIYKTVQVWRRDMELLGRMAEMERLRDQVEYLQSELEFMTTNWIKEQEKSRGVNNENK